MKPETKEGLDRYAKNRIHTGGFLRAVLANDLFESFARADLENRADLFEITSYIYNELPAICWGSYDIVVAWLAKDDPAITEGPVKKGGIKPEPTTSKPNIKPAGQNPPRSESVKSEVVKYIVCPFCGEDDFDLIGLKHHLNVYCDNYQKIQAL